MSSIIIDKLVRGPSKMILSFMILDLPFLHLYLGVLCLYMYVIHKENL